MYEYLIELTSQEKARYRKDRGSYELELNKYYSNLASYFNTPSNRVNAFMALAIMILPTISGEIGPCNYLVVKGGDWFGQQKYLWTAYMILGWILPNHKFDHDAINTFIYDPNISHEDRLLDIKAQLGWFSRFSNASLYETEFKPLLNKDEIQRFLKLSNELIQEKLEAQRKQKIYEEEIRLAYKQKELEKAKAAEIIAKQNAIRTKNENFLSICKQANTTLDMIDFHLSQGAQLDYQDNHGNTALIYAIRAQNNHISEYLLKKGANPFLVNHAGETALTLVSKQSPIFMMLKDLQLTQWLQHPPPVLQLNHALHEEICTASPKAQKIKQLLDLGAEINYQDQDGYTGLMLAVDREYVRIVRYLLNQNANPLLKNKNGETASDLAEPSSLIFKMLKGYELHQATHQDDLQKIIACLSAGADINFQDQQGMTPLLIAVEQGSIQLTTFFLSRGADLTLNSSDGKGVFEFVTDEEIYKLLQSALESKQPKNAPPADSTTYVEKSVLGFFTTQPAPVLGSEQELILNNLLLKSSSDPTSALRLAEIYEQGKHDVVPSMSKALEFYIQASCLGEVKASFYLATLFESGCSEIASDQKQAFKYYACAALQNHPDAKTHLEQLARSGNPQAQFALGHEYYRFIPNTLDTVYWCTSAAIQEHEQALSYLSNTQLDATIYFKIALQFEAAEMNPRENLTRAIEFYTKAMALNHKDAAMQLGRFYLVDHGEIKKNPEKAFSCLMKATTLGHPDSLNPLETLADEMGSQAQFALADFYRSRLNHEKAAYWKTKASEETLFEFNL